MKFSFKAKDKKGEVTEGTIEAANSQVAIQVLQQNQLFPISLQTNDKAEDLRRSVLKMFDRVNAKELVIFFRQMSILIEAKVPIISALRAIKEQSNNPYFQKVLDEAIRDIEDGMSFSEALKKHKDVFSNFSISIIKAGEVSGNLRKSVTYVADNTEKNYALSSKIRSAMAYPIVVLAVFSGIAFFVMAYIVPKMTQIIKDMGAPVPWYTQVVITLGDFMSRYWWAMLLVIFGAIGGLFYYVKTDDGRREWDQIKLRLPIAGRIFQQVYIARFADNLAVLLSGGIPIIRALTVVSSVINNTMYETIFLKAADEVKVGGNMSDVFRKYPLIPPIVSQMVRIGEESGQVDIVLRHIANFYEQETDEATKNLSTLIEPVLIVLIGVGVGVLAVSVLMPIYNIAGQM